jgi:CelD/BcsL family acetyltransferase involved in cellulose biosynthesis
MQEVCSLGGLGALAPEWSELCDRCPWSTPFQRPEWLLPWCKHFDLDEPWVLALRDEGRLVALLPCFVYTSPRDDRPGGAWVEERVVSLLGTVSSDYGDVIADPCREAEAMAAFLSHLDERADRWDVCDLEQLRPDSPLLAASLPQGWTEQRALQSACPVVALWQGAHSLRDVVPVRQVRELARLQRHTDRHGGMGIVTAGADDCGAILAALVQLHGARWRQRGSTGVLTGEELERFHDDVVAGFAARGALALLALYLEGQIVAVSYGFYERREALLYLTGFDPRWSHCGPGVLLQGAAIEAAMRRGCERYDFLRGRDPYKYSWGAKDRWNSRRRLRRGPGRSGAKR